MFARFDENPAMTLKVIKETKRYGRTHRRTHGRKDGRMDGQMDGQHENSIPTTNKVCGGYNNGEIDLNMGENCSFLVISVFCDLDLDLQNDN